MKGTFDSILENVHRRSNRPTGRKKKRLLAEVAEVTVEVNQLSGSMYTVPHDSVIELQPHELERQLSRTVQQWLMGKITGNTPRKTRCPDCQTICDVSKRTRAITALDGDVDLLEPKAYCRQCRQDLFSRCWK